jgi:hypothetical protein
LNLALAESLRSVDGLLRNPTFAVTAQAEVATQIAHPVTGVARYRAPRDSGHSHSDQIGNGADGQQQSSSDFGAGERPSEPTVHRDPDRRHDGWSSDDKRRGAGVTVCVTRGLAQLALVQGLELAKGTFRFERHLLIRLTRISIEITA